MTLGRKFLATVHGWFQMWCCWIIELLLELLGSKGKLHFFVGSCLHIFCFLSNLIISSLDVCSGTMLMLLKLRRWVSKVLHVLGISHPCVHMMTAKLRTQQTKPANKFEVGSFCTFGHWFWRCVWIRRMGTYYSDGFLRRVIDPINWPSPSIHLTSWTHERWNSGVRVLLGHCLFWFTEIALEKALAAGIDSLIWSCQ